MKLLFFVIVVLVGAVGLALLAQNESGYVLINYGPWSVETSFTFAVLVLLLGFALFYAVLRLIAGAVALPGRLRAWRGSRRALRARLVTHRGLAALAEGHWLKAERDLSRYAERSEMPLLNYLGAARAAQMLGDEERRDYHLSMAHRSSAEGELAVGVTQAELQIASGQLEQALATLMHLHGKSPKNVRVLQLLQETYERLGSWSELVALLPELRKRRALEDDAADLLERRAWETLLRQAHEHGNLDKLRELWERIPRQQRQHVGLLGGYARGLLALGGGDEAENLLREAVRRQWDAELVRLYGLAEGKDPTQQLVMAEEWLKRHQRHPLLLLTLGRIAMRAQLWGKARAYLEASAGMEARAETYRMLGELLERLGEGAIARDYYHKGLALVTGNGRSGPVVPLKRFPLMTRNSKK
jgi:HemY protein